MHPCKVHPPRYSVIPVVTARFRRWAEYVTDDVTPRGYTTSNLEKRMYGRTIHRTNIARTPPTLFPRELQWVRDRREICGTRIGMTVALLMNTIRRSKANDAQASRPEREPMSVRLAVQHRCRSPCIA